MLKLGGPTFGDCSMPDLWIAQVKRQGYRAAYCPLAPEASDEEVRAYTQAAKEADVEIAETGAWGNPLSPDPAVSQAALEKCKQSLLMAERIGARCCVNISGSRGEGTDGPHPDNLTDETFDLIVQMTRDIIDAVQPTRTFYTLETMPWAYPDSADNYLRLLRAINRSQFGVHFDPVNLICSPQRYFDNANLIREFIAKLGPHIKSCHAKDIVLRPELTVHLDEVRPGAGSLDYHVFLSEIARLEGNVPVMLEHLPSEEEYALAATHLRAVAAEIGIAL